MTRRGASEFDSGFFGVDLDVGVDAADEGVGEAFLDSATAPGFGLLLSYGCADILQGFAMLYETLCGVGAAVEENIFDEDFKFGLDVLVDLQHAGVDDAHIHAGLNRMEQKGGVHGFADLVVAAKAEGDVGDAAGDLGVGKIGFNPAGGFDKVDSVVIMLVHAGGDGEDVGVEDDVFRRKADLVDEDAVGALADADLLREGGGLAILVKRHDDDGSTVLEDRGGVAAEGVLALLEGDGVDDALALEAFESGFNDLPFGRVDHEGNLGHLGLGGEKLKVAGHSGDAVDHALVHADVDDVGTVFNLLACDADSLFVLAILDELCELW